MALLYIWALIAASVFCVATAQTACGASTPTTGTCSAIITVQPTQPGRSYMYNNINVQNNGSCGITRVFVNITLPPYSPVFAYYNVSNQTGELLGLPELMAPGSTILGGTIVLNSARTPIVVLGSVECDPTCSGEQQSAAARSVRSHAPIHPEQESAKVEVQWGSNPWSLAIHLVGDSGATQEVRLTDSASVSQKLMKLENWDSKSVYTFSGTKLVLPISLELTSIENDKITLENVITSFSYVIMDTGLSYADSALDNSTDDEVTLQVHPDSNSHWIGIAPDSARNITHMVMKASNMKWMPMPQPIPGLFEFSSPQMEIELPISIKLAFDDGEMQTIENAIVAFPQ